MIERLVEGKIFHCSVVTGDTFSLDDFEAPSTITLSIEAGTGRLLVTQPTGAAGFHHMIRRVGSPSGTRRVVLISPTNRIRACDCGPVFLEDFDPVGGYHGAGMIVPIGYNGQRGIYEWKGSTSPTLVATTAANDPLPHTSAIWVDGTDAEAHQVGFSVYTGELSREYIGQAGFAVGSGSGGNVVAISRFGEYRDRYITVRDLEPGQLVEILDTSDVVGASANADENGVAVIDILGNASFLDGCKAIRIGGAGGLTLQPPDRVWPGDIWGEPEPPEPPQPPPAGALEAEVNCELVTLRATLDDGPAVVVTWQIARIDDPDFADPVLVVGPTAPQWEEPPEGSFFGRLIFQAQLPAGTYLARVLAFTIVGFEGLNPIFQPIATPAPVRVIVLGFAVQFWGGWRSGVH